MVVYIIDHIYQAVSYPRFDIGCGSLRTGACLNISKNMKPQWGN